MNKKITVDVNFSHRNGLYKAKLKVLHNDSHLIAKDSCTSTDRLEVFKYVSDFITKSEATNITTKRGLIEDSFAKYLTNTQQSDSLREEDKEIEGVLVSSVPEDYQDTLADLRVYKLCLEDTIRHKDYLSLLFQGVLYNNARKELLEGTGLLANPFEATVSIPIEDRQDFYSALSEINETHLELEKPTFQSKRFKRVVYINSKDYELTVYFE